MIGCSFVDAFNWFKTGIGLSMSEESLSWSSEGEFGTEFWGFELKINSLRINFALLLPVEII